METAPKTVKERYDAAVPKRKPYLDRAREAARLTIPYLIPPEGVRPESPLPDSFQSVGAAGVNHLAAKIALTLFPANTSFFRNNIVDKDIEAVLEEEQAKEDAMIRFMGSKMRLLTPNTVHKMMRSLDPSLRDPASFEQMVLAQIFDGAGSPSVPYAYDALGNVRKLSDVGGLWNIFNQRSSQDREKGLSAKQVTVLNLLDDLAQQTGSHFTAPYKRAETGTLDLRKEYTADGTETYYDRWQRYYQELHPEDGLLEILQSQLPTGTHKVNGMKLVRVKDHLNKLRSLAFQKLLLEESQLSKRAIAQKRYRLQVQQGQWDQPR